MNRFLEPWLITGNEKEEPHFRSFSHFRIIRSLLLIGCSSAEPIYPLQLRFKVIDYF